MNGGLIFRRDRYGRISTRIYTLALKKIAAGSTLLRKAAAGEQATGITELIKAPD